jgi:hypothetical protein
MQAAIRGHQGMVETLLARGADINAPDHRGWTALMYCARKAQHEVLVCLLAQGADVTARNNHGKIAEELAEAFETKKLFRVSQGSQAVLCVGHGSGCQGEILSFSSCLSACRGAWSAASPCHLSCSTGEDHGRCAAAGLAGVHNTFVRVAVLGRR